MRLKCHLCAKSVSTEVPTHTTVRAFIECPECMSKRCMWTLEEDGFFETDCGQTFIFEEGGVEDNGFNWCPYCGRGIDETA